MISGKKRPDCPHPDPLLPSDGGGRPCDLPHNLTERTAGIFRPSFHPGGMILGQTILIIPIMTGLVIAALSGVGREIHDTLVSLGATSVQSIIQIVKEARIAILSAVILGFGRAISEVGVAMMIGGNIRGETRVLTTAIALQTGLGDFGFSIALGIILLLIALVIVIIMYLITSGSFGGMIRLPGVCHGNNRMFRGSPAFNRC